MDAGPAIIDKDLALERAGGNADLASELFAMLLKELPQYRERLQAASQAQDYPGLQEVVHKLNGSATYCGVPALKQAADGFETRLKRGQTDTAEAEVETLLQEITRLAAYAEEQG